MFVSASYLKRKNDLVFRDLLELNCDSYSAEDIITRFVNAWKIDPKRAIRTLIELRYQYGEKRVFQIICFYIAKKNYKFYYSILQEIPKIGSWKDVLQIAKLAYNYPIDYGPEEKLFAENINDPFCAKWAPSENSHYDKEIGFAKQLMNRLKMTPKQYRQTLTRGRKQLHLIESSLSQKRKFNNTDPPIISREAREKYQRRLKNVNYYRTKTRNYDEQAIDEAYERIVKNIVFPSGIYYDPELVAKIQNALK